ncbi:CYTH domain-containing protein [Desulfovibrio sp. OttesenSCG-928-G15]|nr:CYTH domain-containing protein [Desulfovibrio sp. OttesenSCG-928-G15]
MAKEIERKFLPSSDDWRGLVEGERLEQGYLAANADCAIRVRIAGKAARLGIKGKTSGATRSEFEYAVPLDDARAMLDELAKKPLIDKTRYKIPFAGKIWEVDEFHGENQGLVIIEVELQDEGEAVQKPHWVGQEVTGNAAYYNASLVSKPFSGWK